MKGTLESGHRFSVAIINSIIIIIVINSSLKEQRKNNKLWPPTIHQTSKKHSHHPIQLATEICHSFPVQASDNVELLLLF